MNIAGSNTYDTVVTAAITSVQKLVAAVVVDPPRPSPKWRGRLYIVVGSLVGDTIRKKTLWKFVGTEKCLYICKIDNTHKTDLSNVMDKKKTKEDVLRSFKAALEHKKAWQKQCKHSINYTYIL